MAGALLLGLMGDCHVTAVHRPLDLVAAFADDHDPLLRSEAFDIVEKVKEERSRGDRMQHLVRVRAHPSSLAGGKDHDGKIGHLAHPAGVNGTGQWFSASGEAE
jgi:hypothetical protein